MKDLNIEKILKSLQKYLENKPLLVIGSGLSAPYGIPSMSELSEKLIERIDNSFKGLKKWEKFKENLIKINNLEVALQESAIDEELNDKIVVETWKIITEKDLSIYDSIILEELRPTIIKVFNILLEAHPKSLSVITLNYDRIIEYSADLIGAKIVDGFTGNYIKYFDTSDNPYKNAEKHINLWKVHGSLDWFEDINGNTKSLTLTREIPSSLKPLIITPDNNKYQKTHRDPYRSIITASDKEICDASCYLCIGYGFNDEHIQPKLIDQIKRLDKPIVVVTKELTEKSIEILKSNSDRFIAFEKNKKRKTKIYINSFDDCLVHDEELWKLENFIYFWLGD